MKKIFFLFPLFFLVLAGCVHQKQTENSAPVVAQIDDKQLAKAIDAGIERYIQKQQQAQQNAQQVQQQQAEEQAKNVVGIKESDHIRGNTNAEIVLIEYSDFECPFCKRFHPTAKEILAKNPDMAWVYRHFPLSFHDPLATTEAIASECAAEQGGNEMFWKYADTIYKNTRSNGRGLTKEQLFAFAKDLGLESTAFEECVNNKTYSDHVQNDIAEGSAAGITGTPGNILLNTKTGEVRLIPGAVPAAVIQQAIDDLKS